MVAGKAASWAHAEEFVGDSAVFPDESVLLEARERGRELGVAPVLPGTGAMLRVLAAAVDARAVVEIGTGAGVGALYMLSGMHPDGVLTKIDPEAENQRAARIAIEQAHIRPGRMRTIAGQPREVLSRLTDRAYDMVVLPAMIDGAEAMLDQIVRILRPGGVLAVTHALYHDRVADPASRDATTTSVRALLASVRDREDLTAALTGSGDGLLVAVVTQAE